MALIQRFEDIQAWQEARKFVKMVYQLTTKDLFAKHYGLAVLDAYLVTNNSDQLA